MKKIVLAMALISLFSCEKEDLCPEGSYEWNDGGGNLIDCIDLNIPNFNELKNKDVFIEVKKNSDLNNTLKLLK